ncbi:MAG TPA: hypothetical protein VG125_04975, partial [Pirellulales bacterium]|nr:hypothetical protein [Pirellulales bacterium]
MNFVVQSSPPGLDVVPPPATRHPPRTTHHPPPTTRHAAEQESRKLRVDRVEKRKAEGAATSPRSADVGSTFYFLLSLLNSLFLAASQPKIGRLSS